MKATAVLIAKKGGWAVADQILSSGTNFAASIVVARLLGPKEFGSYVVAYSASMVALSITRSFAVDPYLIQAAPLVKEKQNEMTKVASGLVLLAGAVGSVVLSLIALVSADAGSTRAALLTMAAILPGCILQDFWRQACFANGETSRAFANDLVWALVQAVSFLILWAWFRISTRATILAWGAGAVAAAFFGLAQFRILPVIGSRTFQWMKQIAAVGGWFGLTNVLFNAGNLTISLLTTTFCGRSGLGGYQTANNLFSPSNVVVSACQAVGVPLLSREHAAKGPFGVRRGAKIYSLLVGSVLTTYGLAVIAFGPTLLGTVFGKAYAEFSKLILPCALTFLLNAWATGAAVGLIAMASGRTLLGVQSAILTVQIPLLILLASRYGVSGVAWAATAGAALRFVLVWRKCLVSAG